MEYHAICLWMQPDSIDQYLEDIFEILYTSKQTCNMLHAKACFVLLNRLPTSSGQCFTDYYYYSSWWVCGPNSGTYKICNYYQYTYTRSVQPNHCKHMSYINNCTKRRHPPSDTHGQYCTKQRHPPSDTHGQYCLHHKELRQYKYTSYKNRTFQHSANWYIGHLRSTNVSTNVSTSDSGLLLD